jgi:hypothetical protein
VILPGGKVPRLLEVFSASLLIPCLPRVTDSCGHLWSRAAIDRPWDFRFNHSAKWHQQGTRPISGFIILKTSHTNTSYPSRIRCPIYPYIRKRTELGILSCYKVDMDSVRLNQKSRRTSNRSLYVVHMEAELCSGLQPVKKAWIPLPILRFLVSVS